MDCTWISLWWRLLRHRRAVVMDHAPTVGPLCENIRGKNCGGNRLPSKRTIQIFIKCNPGKVIANLNRQLRQREANRRLVLKNPPPALHDRIPTSQHPPSRMATLDLSSVGPDL